MTYSWQNEDGEPIMDGAAWRYEQSLDAENPPYDPDDYLPDYDGEDDEDDDQVDVERERCERDHTDGTVCGLTLVDGQCPEPTGHALVRGRL